MAGKLKLIIYNETVSPGTNKIFEAQKLSWANILDIWDECVSFYEGKYYIIQNEDRLNEENYTSEDSGIVISSASGTFKYNAEKDPDTFVGNVNYNTGNPVVISTTGVSEADKPTTIQAGIFDAFIKELCSKITIQAYKKDSTTATITSATYAETIDQNSNEAQYTITWDEQDKKDLLDRLTITYSNYTYSGNAQS